MKLCIVPSTVLTLISMSKYDLRWKEEFYIRINFESDYSVVKKRLMNTIYKEFRYKTEHSIHIRTIQIPCRIENIV